MPAATAASLFADARSINWMQYAGMSLPDPINGGGNPPGYQRMGLFDTLKPQYPVEKVDLRTEVGGMEKESGVSANVTDPATGKTTFVMNKLDLRYAEAFGGVKVVKADIALTATQLKSTSKRFEARLGKRVAFGFYVLPIWNVGEDRGKHRDAVKAFADAGVGEYVDFFFADAHPNSDQNFAVWKERLDVNAGVVGDVFPKHKLVVLVQDQWAHGALAVDENGLQRPRWCTGADILGRYAYARVCHKNVWTVARMGGYDGQSLTGEKGFFRRPWGSHPDNVLINKILGA